LNPHGLAGIDELDKGTDDVKFSLLGVMQNGKLKIRKTNVQADLPCVVNILATANPTEDLFDVYDKQYWWQQVALPKPLYDRFTFVLIFVQDVRQIKSFEEYFKRRSSKREGVSVQLRLVLRELLRDAWRLEPAILDDKETLQKMDRIMLDVIVPNRNVFGQSLRLTEVLPGLLEALCRLTGAPKPLNWHFEKATDLLLAVKRNHDEARALLGRGGQYG
jgi:MoxR-like ATPase